MLYTVSHLKYSSSDIILNKNVKENEFEGLWKQIQNI